MRPDERGAARPSAYKTAGAWKEAGKPARRRPAAGRAAGAGYRTGKPPGDSRAPRGERQAGGWAGRQRAGRLAWPWPWAGDATGRRRHILRVLSVAVLVLALVGPVAGCGWGSKDTPATGTAEKPPQPPAPRETKVKVTLYFGDEQALYLLPEDREVTTAGEPLPEVVVRELIKGPRLAGHRRTIPEGTVLRGVEVRDGVAYVDFSREFQTRHWGGTAGEAFTLYSVVNSLARLEGIEKVQFLLEGEVQESILGHADTGGPLAPNWEMVRK